MKMIQIISGNILDAKEDIIGHQVNARGVMGAGVAKAIRKRYPVVFMLYKEYCEENSPHILLGKCQLILVGTDSRYSIQYVANLFGQLNYGRSKYVYTDYTFLKESMIRLKQFAQIRELTVALPYGIGCGSANGDWNIVYHIINDVFDDYDVTLYRLED